MMKTTVIMGMVMRMGDRDGRSRRCFPLRERRTRVVGFCWLGRVLYIGDGVIAAQASVHSFRDTLCDNEDDTFTRRRFGWLFFQFPRALSSSLLCGTLTTLGTMVAFIFRKAW